MEKKFIALVASSSKFSINERDESGSSDNKKSDDEEMGLFVKKSKALWQQSHQL